MQPQMLRQVHISVFLKLCTVCKFNSLPADGSAIRISLAIPKTRRKIGSLFHTWPPNKGTGKLCHRRRRSGTEAGCQWTSFPYYIPKVRIKSARIGFAARHSHLSSFTARHVLLSSLLCVAPQLCNKKPEGRSTKWTHISRELTLTSAVVYVIIILLSG